MSGFRGQAGATHPRARAARHEPSVRGAVMAVLRAAHERWTAKLILRAGVARLAAQPLHPQLLRLTWRSPRMPRRGAPPAKALYALTRRRTAAALRGCYGRLCALGVAPGGGAHLALGIITVELLLEDENDCGAVPGNSGYRPCRGSLEELSYTA